MVALLAQAHSTLTPHSRLALARMAQPSKASATGSVGAFITVDDASAIERLTAAGVTINTITGNIVTARIPHMAIGEVASIGQVRSLQLAQRVELANDSACYYSNVAPAHSGEIYNHPVTGKGVIVGVIDTGVDFNHINLCDNLGRSRVRAAYLPCDSIGQSPVIDGQPLPGSHYDTPLQIAALTTDFAGQSHGTHTTGTAAGSYKANGMSGVAPDADLVICSMPDDQLTDVNIANSIKYIFDVATRLGKPAVINMSISSQEGAHDGSSMLCRLIDEMSGPGRICVLSASNSGSRKHVIDHTFASVTDTLYTCLANYSDHKGTFPGWISLWSSNAGPHSFSFTVVSKSTGAILGAWPIPALGDDDDPYILSAVDNPEFSRFFDKPGIVTIANGVEECNGHYHTLAEYDLTPLSSDYVPAIKVASQSGDRLLMWGGADVVFTRNGHSYMTTGMSAMSASDLVSGDSAISVGSYDSRSLMPLADGGVRVNSRFSLGNISYYSSYGPDARGICRPDVCAPGYSLVSSSSRYDTTSGLATNWASPAVWHNGVKYPYASQYGTSMSAPVVTGAIALWMQINPTLGPSHVKEIIKATSLCDEHVTSRSLWGAGKLDVAAGVEYLLNEAAVTDAHALPLTVYPNPGNGNISIAGLPAGSVNIAIYDMQGRLVAASALNAMGSVENVDYSSTLDDGLYMLSITSASGSSTTKLIVKH